MPEPMLKENIGGQVFPDRSSYGICLRDYFAAAALQGLISNDCLRNPVGYEKSYAKWAYQLADAMLVERAKEL